METERKVTIYDKGPTPWSAEYGEYIQVRSGDIHIPKIDGTEPLRLVCEHFVSCVATGRRPLSDAIAGLTVVEVLEAMGESLADAGRPVTLAQGAAS
jgi:predicted dehydrogenase